jgi:hypothetical protein
VFYLSDTGSGEIAGLYLDSFKRVWASSAQLALAPIIRRKRTSASKYAGCRYVSIHPDGQRVTVALI